MKLLHSGVDVATDAPYLPARADEVAWGLLPNAASRPVLRVPSGGAVRFDTISHEGLLVDQGSDPRAFFGAVGIAPDQILDDALALVDGGRRHQPDTAGPHVVTGPVAVSGARPGDVLEVEVLELDRRAPYGVISNRHGRGALPGEMPIAQRNLPFGATVPPVCLVAHAEGDAGVLPVGDGRAIRFPLRPFLGIMGVAAATDHPVHSVPPGRHGGNLDIRHLGVGARLYLPVQVPDALFYVGDPHFAQGDGEVALTAFEAPLRALLRLTVHADDAVSRTARALSAPWAGTDALHIVAGLDPDLGEAMREATRNAVAFLRERYALPAPVALAYLSAAGDFAVSQVVDQVMGVHCCIRRADLHGVDPTPPPFDDGFPPGDPLIVTTDAVLTHG
ncbi:putative acetamidase/formamidase [Frankia canadensis]|uniref:Putative acetamidase/formamidase n=1 Tax=Frankia canadensis TaxID=1836972 RepID=A0A2I2KVY1_9ACTN|nr:acetamidase/formamidase family protein [Frankia canadensis]SNQ49819.1 putative acetamidase/formamidase [Frankia canadensis]SOU57109.1 putative acetamidase/formamidase [Frankia canadensis]